MKTILKIIVWLTCLFLRLTASICNWIQERLKSGPQPRLWAATDAQIGAEVSRRGLIKRAPQEEAGVDDAVVAVKKLNNVSTTEAKLAVAKARSELPGTTTIQQVIQKALLYA